MKTRLSFRAEVVNLDLLGNGGSMLQRLLLSFLVLAFFAHSDRASAACNPKYVGQLLLEPDANGRSMTVKAPYEYDDAACTAWRVPANAAVDGASIPRGLWTIVGGPWEGA